MSRPTDVSNYEKSDSWANFTLANFQNRPMIVAAYATFIAAAVEAGATVGKDGSVDRPKTDDEIAALLANKQAAWDKTDSRFEDVLLAARNHTVDALTPKWADSEAWWLRYHAESEGYAVFPLISKDDDVRADARKLANSRQLAGDL